MNSYSSYHASTSSDVLFKRFRLWKRQYMHVVIYTSLFWIFVDVFFIMLFSDCTKQVIIPCSSSLAIKDKDYLADHQRNHLGVDEELPRHPKFNGNRQYEKNLTAYDRKNNILNRRKNAKLTKPPGFIEKWFGAGGGEGEILRKMEWFIFVVIEGSNPSSWPGEGGRGVAIPSHLQDEAKKRFKENQFNIIASDLIALNRSISDQRSSRLSDFS